MSRIDDLLNEAAEAFEDGRSPFSTEWLREHDVTSTECIDLSDRIANVLQGYLAAPQVVKEAFPIFSSAGISLEIKEHTFHRLYEMRAMESASQQLKSSRK